MSPAAKLVRAELTPRNRRDRLLAIFLRKRADPLAKARAEIEARAHARDPLANAEYEKKAAQRKAQEEAGQKPKGRDPKESEADATATRRMRHRMVETV